MDQRELWVFGEVNKRRRIIADLRLDKIAAVGAPCQEHATVSIIKRAREGSKSAMNSTGAVLKAQAERIAENELTLAHLREINTEEEQNVTGYEEFEGMADVIQKRDNCTGVEALRKARREHPAAYAKYQAAGAVLYDASIAKATAEQTNQECSAEETAFLSKVDELAARDRLGQQEAMQKTRLAYPSLYKAAFETR